MHHFALAADALDQFVFDESVNIFGTFDGQAAFFDVGDDVDEGIADQFRVVLGNDRVSPNIFTCAMLARISCQYNL